MTSKQHTIPFVIVIFLGFRQSFTNRPILSLLTGKDYGYVEIKMNSYIPSGIMKMKPNIEPSNKKKHNCDCKFSKKSYQIIFRWDYRAIKMRKLNVSFVICPEIGINMTHIQHLHSGYIQKKWLNVNLVTRAKVVGQWLQH